MVIEWLNVTVHPDLREQYVQQDVAIWTPVLARYPGFLGKEVWISPEDLSNVILIVRWATFEQWQAIPQEVLDETEALFQQAMGENTYQITDVKRYQVRKYG